MPHEHNKSIERTPCAPIVATLRNFLIDQRVKISWAAIVSLVVLVDVLLPELHASRIVGIEVSIAPAKAVRLTNSRRVIGSIGNLL